MPNFVPDLSDLTSQIEFKPDGPNRFKVSVPFCFGDGDHPVIILRKREADGGWEYADEGNTIMHFDDGLDADEADDPDFLGMLQALGVSLCNGELTRPVADDHFGLDLIPFLSAQLHLVAQTNEHTLFIRTALEAIDAIGNGADD